MIMEKVASSYNERMWQLKRHNNVRIILYTINRRRSRNMISFTLWCILFVLCWPLALFALVLYPFVWLLLLPFKLLGIAIEGVLSFVAAVIMFPARLLRGRRI